MIIIRFSHLVVSLLGSGRIFLEFKCTENGSYSINTNLCSDYVVEVVFNILNFFLTDK